MKKEKALVLYSGGLDSRLAIKLMQDRGFQVEALHFNLPFGCSCCNLSCNFKFTQMQNTKLTILDITKGNLLREYLEVIKKAEHGTGAGANPCKDCKIFMFKKAKQYADEHGIKIIATGEVLGQRPMSQTKRAMDIIDKAIGFEIRRPLVELGIEGRSREKQRELAKKYKIKIIGSGGGCLLCEKALALRFRVLLKKDLINEKTLPIVSIGRHFYSSVFGWIVVARNEHETGIIEQFGKRNKAGIIKGKKKMPAVYYNRTSGKSKALELQKIYGERDKKKIKKFERWKL